MTREIQFIRHWYTLRGNYYSACDRVITPTNGWDKVEIRPCRVRHGVIAHIISDIRFIPRMYVYSCCVTRERKEKEKKKIQKRKINLRVHFTYVQLVWSLTMVVCLAYDHCFVIKYSNYLADMYTELIIYVEYKINRASWCLFSSAWLWLLTWRQFHRARELVSVMYTICFLAPRPCTILSTNVENSVVAEDFFFFL